MGKKSLSSNRKKREKQSKKLQERVKLGQERSKGKFNNILTDGIAVPLWRPKDGAHIVDIIPYDAGKYDPLVKKGDPTYTFEGWVHTRVGPNDVMYLCPTEMENKPCPICEERQRLRDKGVDKEIWKKLFPKRRNLYNVICYDKGEEKKGIQIWDISYHYFEKQVLAIARKPSRHGGEDKLINFADPINGRSITFTIEPAKSKEDYPSYIGHSFDERDYEIDEELLDAVIVLDENVHRPTYKEIADANEGGDSPDKSSKSKGHGKGSDDNELQDLLDELEDLDEIDELKDFVEENDLKVKIKRKDDEDDVKAKIIEELEDKLGSDKGSDDSDLQDLLDELEDLEGVDDLKDFVEENDLDIKVKRKDVKNDEDEVKAKIEAALVKKLGGKGGGDNQLQDLLDELEDLDDMDELKDFIEENDLKVKIKRKDDEDDVKDKITDELGKKFDDIPF